MSCHVIYYENGAKMMRPVLTAAEYRNLRNSERQKQMVNDVRKGDASQKHNLLQFNYSCIPGLDMKLKGCTVCSNSVGMDIDHIAKEKMMKPECNITEEELQRAKQIIDRMLEKGGKLSDACKNCGMCEKKCPQHLQIRDELKKVEALFK